MLSHFRRLLGDNKGVTAIEYTLIAALVGVASIAAYRSIGTQVSTTLNNIGTAIAGAYTAPTTGGGNTGGGTTPGTN